MITTLSVSLSIDMTSIGCRWLCGFLLIGYVRRCTMHHAMYWSQPGIFWGSRANRGSCSNSLAHAAEISYNRAGNATGKSRLIVSLACNSPPLAEGTDDSPGQNRAQRPSELPPTLGEEGLLCFHIVFGQNTKVFRVSTRGRQLLGTMYRGKCLGFAVLQTIL